MSNAFSPITGKAVWMRWIIVIGILAALPLAFFRWQSETEMKHVEVLLDYTDMISLSSNSSNPMREMIQTLSQLKDKNITSIAVDEITMDDLRVQRRILPWTADELGMLSPADLESNDTFIGFVDDPDVSPAEPLRNWIKERLTAQGLIVSDWNVPKELRADNKIVEPGLRIARGNEELKVTNLGIEPFAIGLVNKARLQPVIKISNRMKPFNETVFAKDAQTWSEAGVKRVIFFGEEATGYGYKKEDNHIERVAEIFKENKLGLAAIELLKKDQLGFDSIAQKLNYNVVRLHAINEKDPLLLQADTVDARDQLVDRLALAVKDRGIRMIYLNAKWAVDRERMIQINPLPLILNVLAGSDGAVAQWKAQGYDLGPATAMKDHTPLVLSGMKLFVAVAAFMWVVVLIRYYLPLRLFWILLIGISGMAGLGVLSMGWLWKLLALGVGIAAPTCGIIFVLNKNWITSGAKSLSRWATTKLTIAALIGASMFSLAGALLIIGLLNDMPYYLVLDQYRGVVLLHSIPILLTAIYAMFYWNATSWHDVVDRMKSFLSTPIKIFGLIIFVIGAAGFAYYLTRTGNEGAVSPIERMYRAYLESFFGVRPRTKEFLIAHPMFILAAFAWRVPRYRLAAVVFGALGQLSIVDTFAHLHTPIWVSLTRVCLGLAIGLVISIGFILAWELLKGSWNRWAGRLLS